MPDGTLHIVMPYERCSYECMVHDEEEQPQFRYASYDLDELVRHVTETHHIQYTDNTFVVVARI